MSDMEEASARRALEFIRRIAQTCERLAARNIVVLSVFTEDDGSWKIEASNGDYEDWRGSAILAGDYDAPGSDSLRVFWEGRDRVLITERQHHPTVIEGHGHTPLGEPAPYASSEEALAAAEALLIEHLADST